MAPTSEEWETAVTIAYDALRLCLGFPPKRWTAEEVKLWLDCIAAPEEADD